MEINPFLVTLPDQNDGRPVLVIPRTMDLATVEAMVGVWNIRVIHSEPVPETYEPEEPT